MSLKIPYHLYRCDSGRRQAGSALIIHCQSCLNCVWESMAAPQTSDENKIKDTKKKGKSVK